MTMPSVSPTSPEPGVPLRRPVAALNVAHAGAPITLKTRELPSTSEATGVKE
jgi:hypothetical protein